MMHPSSIRTAVFISCALFMISAFAPFNDAHATGFRQIQVGGDTVSMSTALRPDIPSLKQFQAGVRLGYAIKDRYILGISADYRSNSQSTGRDSTTGDWSGSRFNPISPMIGIKYHRFVVLGEYYMLGDYVLASKTATGESVSYQGTSGFRISAHVKTWKTLYLGLQYDSLSLAKEKVGSASAVPLSSPLKMNSIGLGISVVF